MKAKKARRRLQEVDGLLAKIIAGYEAQGTRMRELLDSAKAAVSEMITSLQKPARKKPPARAAMASRRGPSGARRKGPSLAVRRRRASSKSSLHEASGRGLHKTA